MEARTALERIKALFQKSDAEDYEPLVGGEGGSDSEEDVAMPSSGAKAEQPFSWFEYTIFMMLGIAMLWAWNMFLAAAPYFQSRFADNERILSSFQSAITSVSTITSLSSMLVLGNMQAKASYPKRITSALILNIVVFTLLCISTTSFKAVSSGGYLAFTLIMVFTTSIATGLCQNGAFAFASSFGRPEYIQAIMTGQGIAGVLPSVAQIVSVLAVPKSDNWSGGVSDGSVAPGDDMSTSAFVYFLTAALISIATLFAILPLIRKHNRLIESQMMNSITSVEEAEQAMRKVVGMVTLYKKLYWLAGAVFLCFTVTMFFPVFTGKIVSVTPPDEASRLFQPATFIPLGFLLWNVGDLSGRLLTLLPATNLRHRPAILFLISVLRAGHLPLYLLCNIQGKGAAINSDAFYLVVVQLFFGLTNGWLGSSCMMAAGEWVDESEREAAGGFMAINLVAGLTAGSLLSFLASDVQ
ncbi:nucleoside transporter [Phlyctema vagabunda]|uniref:Nucleoside transporter n=1 Tax=Phlyctema vagabunda TaxID=108571 RepID=A0ABR4PNL4_9HELO